MVIVLDLNSYFASVEQQCRTSYRKKPLVVVPSDTDTTSCIAASYEAKAFGIKTGTLLREAKRVCPQLVVVCGNHRTYIEFHHKIAAAIEECIPISKTMSIDEFACELMGRENKKENALALAQKIKNNIYKRVGTEIRSSIGIAPNQLLAKIASDRQKPDGLVWWGPEELPQALFQLQLKDLPGVGHNMERRILLAGVPSVEALYNLSSREIIKIWGGIHGEQFLKALHGEVTEDLDVVRRSVSHSHVLPPSLRSDSGAWSVAQKLLHKAASRLRKMNYWAQWLYVSVKYTHGERWSADTKIIETQDNFTLLHALSALWKKKAKIQRNPIKVSVWLGQLVPDAQHHFSFFEDEKTLNLSRALDSIESKFGKGSLYFAGTTEAQEAAPLRIAFTNIPEVDSP